MMQWKLLEHTQQLYIMILAYYQAKGWKQYDDTHASVWVSVFGTSNADAPLPSGVTGVINDPVQAAGS